MKTTTHATLNIMFAFLAMFAMASCTSTDILESSVNDGKGTTITLNVTSPDAYVFSPTRADGTDPHEGHQLRYVAKLFKKDLYAGEKFVERKEILASDGTNMIIFQQPEGDYIVTLFADYIDINSTVNDKGCYPDKYYDTSSEDKTINMIAIQNKSGDKIYSDKCNINNDNYDCFAINHEFTKGALIYEKTLVLKRAVSKVRIINKGGNPAGVDKIKITNFSYLNEYSFETGTSANHIDVSASNIKEHPIEFIPTDLTNNELFYFYTFAYYDKGPSEISFNIIGKDNYVYAPVIIESGLLMPKANYILNVRGNFLSPTTSPSNEIQLTVSTSEENWNSSDNNVN